MTIIPILFICLLSLTSTVVYAEEINLTFEIMQVSKVKQQTLEARAKILKDKGFICHIEEEKEKLFLRCNDTQSIDEMQKSMNAFKENKIDYTISYKTLRKTKKHRDPNKFYLGYKAYNKAQYAKALQIFEYNYKKNPNLEYSYAYALTLMKFKQYSKALEVLKKFKGSTKANKLSKDIAETYMYEKLLKKDYIEAHTIVKKYMHDNNKYHSLITQKKDVEKYMIALKYFQEKNYNESLNILLLLKKNSPKAEKLYNTVLYVKTLDAGWQELKHDSKNALVLFKQACKLNNTVSCKKGMMYAYYKNRNYSYAYSLAEELYSLKQNDEFASLAMYSAKALKKIVVTKEWYKKIQNKKGIANPNSRYANIKSNKNRKITSYVRQGDRYKEEKDYKAALNAYRKAIALNRNDVNIEILYLYTLKDFKKHTLLETELQKAYKKYPKQTNKLNDFKYVYQKSKLYSYYKNKHYKECLTYAKKIEKNFHDEEIYRLGGWCAYALEDYNEAKEQFTKIATNNEDSYAYALSSYHNNTFNDAINTLSKLTPSNDEERLKIASLYANLSMQKKAQELAEDLPSSIKKDTLKLHINKSYFYNRHDNALSAGVNYRTRSAYDGKNQFNIYSIPLNYNYVDPVKNYHLYLEGNLLRLSTTNIDPMTDFGFNTLPLKSNNKKNLSFSTKIGIDYNNIRAEIGFTPIGYDIDPEFLWLLSYAHSYENLSVNVAFTQKEIDDTMLSYVGEETLHPDSDNKIHWGRVVKQGYTANINYEMDDIILALNLEYYPKIHGQNVIENSEFKTTAMMLYFPDIEYFSFMKIGLLANYDSYDKDSDLYTYGHGGYFSPQEFWLGSVFAQFGDYISDKLYYQSKLSLGYEWYKVANVDKFPLNSDISEIQSGYTNSGITYKAVLQLGYKLTDNLDLVSAFSIEKMQEYETKHASFAFTYRFKSNKNILFDTFKLNCRIEDIMK